MSTFLRTGQRDWRMTRDRDGHREYKITFRVVTDSKFVGPAEVLQTSGLPISGDYWIVDNDADLWATCKEDAEVVPVVTNEPNFQWDVTMTFSTKWDDKRCKDQQIDDPLLVPDRVSGSFTRFTEQATFDRFGAGIVNSAFERIEDKQVEFDASRANIKISQNRADLEIELFTPMVDTVNDATLWGLPPRTVKLSNVTWERKYYGQCYLYYERTFEFEVRYNPGSASDFLGFDRLLLDEANKVLKGHYAAKGSGCTVDITTSSGAIVSASVNALGSGYEEESTVYLYVTGGTGQGGLVAVESDTTGAIDPTTCYVVGEGSGYTNGTGITTTVDVRWILDNVSPGVKPDPKNPNHFIRYKDQNGENARLLLDGQGKPALPLRGGGISSIDAIAGSDDDFKVFTLLPHLLRNGDTVRISGVTGLTAANGLWKVTVTSNSSFTLNGSAHMENGVPMGGRWSTGGVGLIVVQKYSESNFLLLGIPTSF